MTEPYQKGRRRRICGTKGLYRFQYRAQDKDVGEHHQCQQPQQEVPINEAQADLPHFTSEDIDKLAGGLFIYAATVVKYLGDHTPLEQKKLLNKLLSTSNSATSQTLLGATDLLDKLYHVFHGFKGGILLRRFHIVLHHLCTAERSSTSIVTNLLTGDSDSDTVPVLKGLNDETWVRPTHNE